MTDAYLTTDHAASSYGQPVLVIDGNAYGPADVYTNIFGETATAAEWVSEVMQTWRGRVAAGAGYEAPFDVSLVEKFCG